jgi:hypothetical protein
MRLDSEGVAYEEWKTGSRGSHFHYKVQGLAALNDRERLHYRGEVIKRYGTDPAKKNGFIAIENQPHFKTGVMKTLVGKKEGVNEIDFGLLLKIKQAMEGMKSKPLNTSYNKSISTSLKHKWKVSDVLRRYGSDTSSKLTMCPLGHPSTSKKCLHFEDDKGLWFCFNCGTGGDIFTLVMEKENVGFMESVNIIQRW